MLSVPALGLTLPLAERLSTFVLPGFVAARGAATDVSSLGALPAVACEAPFATARLLADRRTGNASEMSRLLFTRFPQITATLRHARVLATVWRPAVVSV